MRPKKIAIVQSSYIPWKGYFDMINMVDEFVLYDNVQFTRRDWRNRNKIKTASGIKWLTVPVLAKGKFLQSVRETKISDQGWAKKHWKTISLNYSKAPFFTEYKDQLEDAYLNSSYEYLSEVNFHFIKLICGILKINTPIVFSDNFDLSDQEKTLRLVSLCKQASAKEYISGPSAKDYLREEYFTDSDIKVTWMDYSGYKEYPQLYPPFEHQVSILDLIFNTGPDAGRYLKSFNG